MEASSRAFGERHEVGLGRAGRRNDVTHGDATGSDDKRISASKDQARGRPPGQDADAAKTSASSIAVPLQFVVTGMLALFTGVVMLALRPDLLAAYHYNPHAIAVTHLFTLGWITSVIMGAMYQLVPVALETKLYSERLARAQFVAHLVGFVGMVWMFWVWNPKQVGQFGSIMGFGIGLFVYNIARTLKRIPRWNVIAAAIAAALF